MHQVAPFLLPRTWKSRRQILSLLEPDTRFWPLRYSSLLIHIQICRLSDPGFPKSSGFHSTNDHILTMKQAKRGDRKQEAKSG